MERNHSCGQCGNDSGTCPHCGSRMTFHIEQYGSDTRFFLVCEAVNVETCVCRIELVIK